MALMFDFFRCVQCHGMVYVHCWALASGCWDLFVRILLCIPLHIVSLSLLACWLVRREHGSMISRVGRGNTSLSCLFSLLSRMEEWNAGFLDV
jgi:hypothetical protein